LLDFEGANITPLELFSLASVRIGQQPDSHSSLERSQALIEAIMRQQGGETLTRQKMIRRCARPEESKQERARKNIIVAARRRRCLMAFRSTLGVVRSQGNLEGRSGSLPVCLRRALDLPLSRL